MHKKIVIVDIDGTIADCTERAEKFLGDNPDWDAFYDACDQDKPIQVICHLVALLWKYFDILFVTGRRESTDKKTRDFIRKYIFGDEHTANILYRKNGDKRHDTLVKPELLEAYLKENRLDSSIVEFILEDRNSMVAKWRELGFTCLQTQEGNF